MADRVDPNAFVILVDLAFANRYKLEAIVELLDKKGVLTKAELLQ